MTMRSHVSLFVEKADLQARSSKKVKNPVEDTVMDELLNTSLTATVQDHVMLELSSAHPPSYMDMVMGGEKSLLNDDIPLSDIVAWVNGKFVSWD